MSLPTQQQDTIPKLKAQVAHAIYPDGNPVMRLLDALHRKQWGGRPHP